LKLNIRGEFYQSIFVEEWKKKWEIRRKNGRMEEKN